MVILVTLVILLFISVLLLPMYTSESPEDLEEKEANKKAVQARHEKIMQGDIYEFKPTRNIRMNGCATNVYIDDNRKRILFAIFNDRQSALQPKYQFYNFGEILDCSILEDGNTTTASGIGRAIVGGVLAGGVGAIVGASTRSTKKTSLSLNVRILTTNLNRPIYTAKLLDRETAHTDRLYQNTMDFAQEIFAVVSAIIRRNEQ